MRPRHQGDACNWGRTHKHRTQAASPVRGVGPQPWPQDAASSDGQPRQGRALLFAEPIRHQNCIIHFINSRLTYGPGLENITPWSWGLTCASTRTVPHGHGSAPCGAQQPYMAAMVGPGCQRKITWTPLLRHQCLVSNLHRVRTMQYNQTLHPPMGPFSRASTTARAAVDILDTIVRLGQHGTRR